jgi:ATP-dependent Clp protease ATP-binding subunit ClpC
MLNHNYIGTEHILLGLIREGEGVAAQVLQKLGADLIRARQQVMFELAGSSLQAPTQPEGLAKLYHLPQEEVEEARDLLDLSPAVALEVLPRGGELGEALRRSCRRPGAIPFRTPPPGERDAGDT